MELPDEILIIIFEKLNVKDLKSITLADRRFNGLVTGTSKIIKKFKLVVNSNYNLNILQALLDSQRYFENLSIPILDHMMIDSYKSDKMIDLMKRIGGHVKKIKFMDFCHCCYGALLELLPNIAWLKFDHNVSCLDRPEKLPTSTIKIRSNQLKEVHISFEMLYFLGHVNTLEKLTICQSKWRYSWNTSEKILEFIEVLQRNRSTLKSLTFSNLTNLFDYDIQALFSILFNLLHNISSYF